MVGSEARDEQAQRVLDAAARLFAESGFDDVTMAEIAAEAAVARATVFNYFGTKHSLLEAITDQVLETWSAMLDDALADDVTPVPLLLRTLCAEMGKGIESQRSLFRGVFREIARLQLGLDTSAVAQRANNTARARLLRLFERGQERGELTEVLAADTLADAFHSLTNGTITTWLYHDPTGPLELRMNDAAEVFLAPVQLASPRRSRAKGTRR
jgi:AcrR family transcriptional regulator